VQVTVLNDHLEVPGLAFLRVNAVLLHALEPVVVDTVPGLPDCDFVRAPSLVIDPADVRRIWLTPQTAITPADCSTAWTPQPRPRSAPQPTRV
jgi:hypothetical protein